MASLLTIDQHPLTQHSEATGMIARIWQARTRPGMGKAYYKYLEETGLKEYQATEGLKKVLVLTREVGDQTEYVLVTLWDDMDAVRRFAGPEPEKAVYYPEDDRYFPPEERRPNVAHYQVTSAP
jgi:heme-degrading monooxygenase HmoA